MHPAIDNLRQLAAAWSAAAEAAGAAIEARDYPAFRQAWRRGRRHYAAIDQALRAAGGEPGGARQPLLAAAERWQQLCAHLDPWRQDVGRQLEDTRRRRRRDRRLRRGYTQGSTRGRHAYFSGV